MFEIKHNALDIDSYLKFRKITGLSSSSYEVVKLGLANSLLAITVYDGDKPIGMGRVVSSCEVVDVEVMPEYRGLGIGRAVMQEVMMFLKDGVRENSSISLFTDIPAFYQKFGFRLCPPGEAMYIRTGG